MSKNQFIVDKNTSQEARRRVFLVLAIISIVLFSMNFVSSTTTVTLVSPANNTNNTLNLINFNCSAETSTGFLTNISLYTNSTGTWHRNLTVEHTNTTSNTTIGNPSFEYISGGLQNWSFWGSTADVTGNYTNTLSVSGNKSYLMIDNDGSGVDDMSIYQLVNFSSIGKDYDYGYIGVWVRRTDAYDRVYIRINETNIGAALEPSINTWTYYYREIPETYTKSTELFNLTFYFDQTTSAKSNWYIDDIKISTINKQQTFPFNLTSSPTLWNCYSCNNNSECSFAASNYSVKYNLFENSRTVPTSASQGSTQTFTLNITATDAVTSAYLNYNGTRYSTSITAGAFTIISTSMVIPAVTADGSATIFWELFTTYGGVNSSSSTMTVATSSVDNCATNKIYIYNFTIRGEDNQAVLNDTTGKVNVQIYSFDRATLITNYSTSQTANHIALCINSTFGATEKFSIDAEVEYSATNYQTEFYNIQNETLQNSYLYQNISLYDLNSTLARVFKIIYKDSGYKAVEDAIIKVYRKYSGDINTWKISEVPITDYNGETTASLVENNVIYSFYVYKYGTLLSSFENVFVKCQYSSIDQCTLYLNDFSSVIDIEDLEDGEDFNFTLDYNSTSREILCTFNIPSGSSHLISLVVKTSDSLETSVCSDSITSSSGTLTCTVPNTFGNSTITAKIYKDGVFQSYGNIKLDQDSSSIYGGSLVLLGLLMLFSLIGASLSGNPVIMIVSFLVGIIALVSLNLISNNGFLGGTAAVLFLVIAIIIILIKVGRRN